MGVKIIITLLIVLLVILGGLTLYGSMVKPPQRSYEQVLPDDRFPK